MRIPLDKLDNTKSQEFLAYFTAELKKRSGSPFLGNSSASFNEKAQYVTSIHDFIETNNGLGTAINWNIIQNIDGHIPEIEIVSLSDIDIESCSNYINSFILEVLTATLGSKKENFFFRKPYLYIGGANINGEYWLSSQCRIAPLIVSDNSGLIDAERIIVIDQLIEAIDINHARILGEQRAIQIAAQLSFILDIGLYEERNEQRWVIRQTKEGEFISERNQLKVWDVTGQKSLPKKGELCPLNKPVESIFNINRYLGSVFNFPRETRELIKGIEKSNPSVVLAFNRAVGLYQTALVAGRYYPTIKLAYLYGAIDSITQSINGIKGFSEFMRKYYPNIEESFLSFMHEKVRSAHWHSGEFAMGEKESKWKESILDPNSHIRLNINLLGHKYIRTAILNWIFEELKNKNNVA